MIGHRFCMRTHQTFVFRLKHENLTCHQLREGSTIEYIIFNYYFIIKA